MTDARIRLRDSFGPGIVFALCVIGPGSFVSNAAVGAAHGYSLLWALALAVALRFVWLRTSARYTLVTGETLLEGYARVSRAASILVPFAMILYRYFSNSYKVILLGSCLGLLAGPWIPPVVGSTVSVLLAFGLVFAGEYPGVERACRVLVALLGAALFLTAAMSGPDLGAMARGLVPSVPPSTDALSATFLLAALVGTEAGSLTNITYSYFVRARGWTGRAGLGAMGRDLSVSAVCIFLSGAAVQVASAAILHPLGRSPEDAEDLVALFLGTLGPAAAATLAVGLWSALFSGYMSGTTGYALVIAEGVPAEWRRRLGWPGWTKEPVERRRDPAYRLLVTFWCLAPLAVLMTDWEPVFVVLAVNAAVAALIPILALMLLRLANDRALMGDEVNGWLANLGLVLLILVAGWVTARNALG